MYVRAPNVNEPNEMNQKIKTTTKIMARRYLHFSKINSQSEIPMKNAITYHGWNFSFPKNEFSFEMHTYYTLICHYY